MAGEHRGGAGAVELETMLSEVSRRFYNHVDHTVGRQRLLDVKLGRRCKGHKGRVGWLA